MITYAVCILCIAMFVHQVYSDKVYKAALDAFCEFDTQNFFEKIQERQGEDFCQIVMPMMRWAGGLDKDLLVLVEESGAYYSDDELKAGEDQFYSALELEFRRFEIEVPPSATTQWKFDPRELNFQKMFTSSFSHADWEHLVFNLIFFFAFSVTAELLLGSFPFLILLLLSCVSTHYIYWYGAFGFDNSRPTLGLSAVVMTFMTMMAVIYPHKKVRVFYWLVFFVGIVRVPLLFLVALYVGMDIYSISRIEDNSNVNYLSHIGGAATGALMAMGYLILSWAREVRHGH